MKYLYSIMFFIVLALTLGADSASAFHRRGYGGYSDYYGDNESYGHRRYPKGPDNPYTDYGGGNTYYDPGPARNPFPYPIAEGGGSNFSYTPAPKYSEWGHVTNYSGSNFRYTPPPRYDNSQPDDCFGNNVYHSVKENFDDEEDDYRSQRRSPRRGGENFSY